MMLTKKKIANFMLKLIELTMAGKLEWLPGALTGVECKFGLFEIAVVETVEGVLALEINKFSQIPGQPREIVDDTGCYKLQELQAAIFQYGSTRSRFLKMMKEQEALIKSVREDSERLARAEMNGIIKDWVEQATAYLEKNK